MKAYQSAQDKWLDRGDRARTWWRSNPLGQGLSFGFGFVFVFVVVLHVSGWGSASTYGQDLGDVLSRMARDQFKAKQDALKQQFQPQNLGRAFTDQVLPGLRAGQPSPGPSVAPGQPGQTNGEILAYRTADGWTLVIHHYPATRPIPSSPPTAPVILCHGLGYNATFFDIEPNFSLARDLARRGYDVWVVNLRGSGLSTKWVPKLENASSVLMGEAIRRVTRGKVAPTGYATVNPKYANWTMDDHIFYDVPATVAFVRQRTGAAEVSWVGHSMGGIVALVHLGLGRSPNPGIGRLVVVGSQVTMPNNQVMKQFLLESLQVRERMVQPTLSVDALEGHLQTSVQNLFFQERHTPPVVYQALTTWAKDTPALGLLNQYRIMSERQELYDAKGRTSYARMMNQVQVPILILGGAADQLAPPRVQRELWDRVGSTDKNLVILGTRQGFAADAGHNDALVGNTAPAQVYPLIARWLAGSRYAMPR